MFYARWPKHRRYAAVRIGSCPSCAESNRWHECEPTTTCKSCGSTLCAVIDKSGDYWHFELVPNPNILPTRPPDCEQLDIFSAYQSAFFAQAIEITHMFGAF